MAKTAATSAKGESTKKPSSKASSSKKDPSSPPSPSLAAGQSTTKASSSKEKASSSPPHPVDTEAPSKGKKKAAPKEKALSRPASPFNSEPPPKPERKSISGKKVPSPPASEVGNEAASKPKRKTTSRKKVPSPPPDDVEEETPSKPRAKVKPRKKAFSPAGDAEVDAPSTPKAKAKPRRKAASALAGSDGETKAKPRKRAAPKMKQPAVTPADDKIPALARSAKRKAHSLPVLEAIEEAKDINAETSSAPTTKKQKKKEDRTQSTPLPTLYPTAAHDLRNLVGDSLPTWVDTLCASPTSFEPPDHRTELSFLELFAVIFKQQAASPSPVWEQKALTAEKRKQLNRAAGSAGKFQEMLLHLAAARGVKNQREVVDGELEPFFRHMWAELGGEVLPLLGLAQGVLKTRLIEVVQGERVKELVRDPVFLWHLHGVLLQVWRGVGKKIVREGEGEFEEDDALEVWKRRAGGLFMSDLLKKV